MHPVGEYPFDLVLPQRETVRMPGGKVADVQPNLGEPGDLGDPENEAATQAMTLDQLFAAITASSLPPVYERMRANSGLSAKYGLSGFWE